MNMNKFAARENLRCQSYEIILTPLDDRCNSLKVEIEKEENRFEQTINVYDFIDIKQFIKAGKTMQEINGLSLLFLKLMISTTISSKRIIIMEAKDIPFEKIIKKKENVQKWVKTGDNQQVKGLLLQLREDLVLVAPRLLVTPPKQLTSKIIQQKQKQQKQQRQQKIKQIFYGGIK